MASQASPSLPLFAGPTKTPISISTSFTLFPQLPLELRTMIWKLALPPAPPGIIEVEYKSKFQRVTNGELRILHGITTNCKDLPLMGACKEAREAILRKYKVMDMEKRKPFPVYFDDTCDIGKSKFPSPRLLLTQKILTSIQEKQNNQNLRNSITDYEHIVHFTGFRSLLFFIDIYSQLNTFPAISIQKLAFTIKDLYFRKIHILYLPISKLVHALLCGFELLPNLTKIYIVLPGDTHTQVVAFPNLRLYKKEEGTRLVKAVTKITHSAYDNPYELLLRLQRVDDTSAGFLKVGVERLFKLEFMDPVTFEQMHKTRFL
jgi:hypothetical protein